MSKVLIISNHWMEETVIDGILIPMTATIFNDKLTYQGTVNNSKRVLATLRVEKFAALAKEVKDIKGFLKLKGTEDDVALLVELVKEILDKTNFGDEEDRDIMQEDIEQKNINGLLQDILEALQDSRNDEQLKEVFTLYIESHIPPLCYSKEDAEYKIVGITSLSYRNAGLAFCHKWIDALIQDFTKEDDEVILALHGSTDWSETDPVLGPKIEFSKELSQTQKRNIRVMLFFHDDRDCIAQVLKSENYSLSTNWNKIDQIWKEAVK